MEIAPLRGAEAPDVAVGPILPPAGLVGVDQRAAAHPRPQLLQGRLRPVGDRPQHPRQPAEAQPQPVQRGEQPVDRPQRQPPDRAQAGDIRQRGEAEPLLAEYLRAQIQRRGVRPPALRADPPPRDVLDDLDRGRRDVQHLPPPHHFAPAPRRPATGAGLHRVLDHPRRRHAAATERRVAPLAWPLCLLGPSRGLDERRQRRRGGWRGRRPAQFLHTRRQDRDLRLQHGDARLLRQHQRHQRPAVALFQRRPLLHHARSLHPHGPFAYPL